MKRHSALNVTEYKAFGGGFFDAASHAEIFRSAGPYNFGVMSARLFSSTAMLGLTNKKWTYLTIAQGNVFLLPAGTNDYEWSVVGDADVDCTIMEDVLGSNTTPGKNGLGFEIVVDRPYVKSPMVLKTESDNAPGLIVLSKAPEPYGTQYYKIRVRLQDGNTNSYIKPKWLQPGRRLTRIGTFLSNEDNQEYGVDSYNSMLTLRSKVGQYGNEVVFNDKFIRKELSVLKGKKNTGYYEDANGKRHRDAFSRGYIYQASLKGEGNKKIQKGFFIGAAEHRLEERTMMDREYMCEWGRAQSIEDNNNRIRKQAPGFRQIVRDGQYLPHGGSFTLNQLYDFLHQVMFRRRGFLNREPMLVSGTGGINYLSTLIAAQAAGIQVVEQGWQVRDVPNGEKTGVHKFEKEWGYQFTKIRLAMGVTVSIMYDPQKDDDTLFKETAPGSYLPLESYQIDILDFGQTEDADELSNKKNICMVMEDGIDYYFSVGNAIDWKKGVVNTGENVYNFNKNFGIYREMSGSLCVWDASAIGRIEWVPGHPG